MSDPVTLEVWLKKIVDGHQTVAVAVEQTSDGVALRAFAYATPLKFLIKDNLATPKE